VPEGWVSSDQVSSFETTTTNALPVPRATALDVEGSYAVAGGLNGEAAIYSVEADNVERTIPVGEPVTDTLWAGSKVFFATSQGNVKVYEAGNEVGTLSEHAGPASGLSLHPSGDLLASVGTDKSIVFYHLETMKRVSRAYADACKFLWLLSQLCVRPFRLTLGSSDNVRFPPRRTSFCRRHSHRRHQAVHDQEP
jgi:pre-mRNA-processing factor 19